MFGCGYSDEQLDALGHDYSEEQLDALERLDPLHLLTDNKTIFTLDKNEVLKNLKEKINLPDWTKQLPDGRMQIEHYDGCTEPVLVYFMFYGTGKLANVIYDMSNYSNTPSVIQDYPTFITQLREDMITLYGYTYTERFPHTECESFEEMIQFVKDNKAVDYTLRFRSNKQLFISLGEGCIDGSMEKFSIAILLEQ